MAFWYLLIKYKTSRRPMTLVAENDFFSCFSAKIENEQTTKRNEHERKEDINCTRDVGVIIGYTERAIDNKAHFQR